MEDGIPHVSASLRDSSGKQQSLEKLFLESLKLGFAGGKGVPYQRMRMVAILVWRGI